MIGRAPLRLPVVGIALVPCCWLVWWLAGMIAGWAGVADLDIVLRVVAVFGFLTFVEPVTARLTRS